jgi:predicted ATPase
VSHPDTIARSVPQADSLDRVRDVVEAIGRNGAPLEKVMERAGLSHRQANYHVGAARSLGLVRDSDGALQRLTELGLKLLSTDKGSAEETSLLARAVLSSSIVHHLAPDLLSETPPGNTELARRIRKETGLAETTSARRAQTLLAWRQRLLQGQMELFQSAQPTTLEVLESVVDARPSLEVLRLVSFKNFADATLHLGPLTVLVGTNASGKSNLRDAFRFLHGIARGYTLAEIIGEKWIEGGVLQWKGIRGGTKETAYRGADGFRLEVRFQAVDGGKRRTGHYSIAIKSLRNGHGPRVQAESLVIEGRGTYVFHSHPGKDAPVQDQPDHLKVRLRKNYQEGFRGPTVALFDNRPALAQLLTHPEALPQVREHVRLAISAFASMRFLDLSPDAMRLPSIPGQTILGDRGENLSSVLYALCENPARKHALLEWLRELTPVDVRDFRFRPDAAGRILVSLVEDDDQETSAYSASDGTLRFLAMIAALLGTEPANLYFYEELENGIHPTRLQLLLQLIEQQTSRSGRQVITTTHSPFLLAHLSERSLAVASLIHRGRSSAGSEIVPIMEIPSIQEVLKKQDLARLHATGWLENILAFGEPV